MKLIIKNCDDMQFIGYLISFLRKYLRNSVYKMKSRKLDEYLASYDRYITSKGYITTSRDIVFQASQHLKYQRYKNKIEIYIDDKIYYPGLNVTLDELCRLINYGNLSVQGSKIFTDSYSYVVNHIVFLYAKYTRGY